MGTRFFILVFLAGVLLVPAFGANFNNTDALKKAGCSEKEAGDIVAIEEKSSSEIDSYKTEIKSIKAQLKDLELPAEMDVAKADKLFRKLYDAEYKEDLAKFTKDAKIKKILGQERWDKALKLLKNKKGK
jgi:hypothetical protein